jgi:hypothetical protein
VKARSLVAAVGAIALLGALQPLDSQVVLDRYAVALADVPVPKAEIFIYNVSQAGPTNIEQRHQIYRSGIDVRDETLAQNGVSLKRKTVRIARRADAYAIGALAPRPYDYELLFLRVRRDGKHLDYLYRAIPLRAAVTGFAIDRVAIDGQSYLPRTIDFHSYSDTGVSGTGTIEFGRVAGYWVPTLATVTAVIGSSVARERIVFSDYRFPPSLPRSTFL